MKNPNENDWEKMAHEMKYIQYTRHLPLIMCAGEKGIGFELMRHMLFMPI